VAIAQGIAAQRCPNCSGWGCRGGGCTRRRAGSTCALMEETLLEPAPLEPALLEPALLDFAGYLVWVCLVEVSLEVFYTGCLIGMLLSRGLSDQGTVVLHFLAVSLNLHRLWWLWEMTREFRVDQNERQSFDGPSLRTNAFSRSPLSFFAISMWYLGLTLCAKNPWAACSLAGFVAINVSLCLLWLYLLCALSKVAGSRVREKAFRHQGEVGKDTSRRFGASCIICLSDLDEGQWAYGHDFHKLCIGRWLASIGCCHMRCPSRTVAARCGAPSGAAAGGAAAAAPLADQGEGGGGAAASASAAATCPWRPGCRAAGGQTLLVAGTGEVCPSGARGAPEAEPSSEDV